jgi:hypothetical protein
MPNSPSVIHAFVQICQQEAPQFNKSSEDSDEEGATILGKIVISAISILRSALKAVSDPKILDKGTAAQNGIDNRTRSAPCAIGVGV